jgi:di/tricarboxylate transporter
MKILYQIFSSLCLAMFLAIFNLANAALPAAIGTALTGVATDAEDLADLIWPVLIAIFGSMVLFKLFKRFGAKI